ncbi:MAG: FGGY family carbohydrate kinase [Bacteroidales bacterium]|nr:FGGY family carbohydrate kinase [Bacteroidales bacterium]
MLKEFNTTESTAEARMKYDFQYLIGLDLGTSTIKGVIINERGSVIAKAHAATELLYPHKGWVETNPEDYYLLVCKVLRELSAAVPGEIRAFAMVAASGNTLLTDASGKPLRNIINWMDCRAEKEAPKVLAELTEAEVSQVTGWPCVTSFPLAHLAWLKENYPELYASSGHYGMDTDWLMYKMTGLWFMDHSIASTFHLQEQTAGKYYEPFLRKLGIPSEKLSKLVDSGVFIGHLTSQAICDTGLTSHASVVSGCFDHPSAARAMGVFMPGQLLLSCGTSWVGLTPCSDRQKILDSNLICDQFLYSNMGYWAGMFSVPYIGRAIDWYINNVIAPGEEDPIRIFNESAAEAKADAGGLRIDLREPTQMITADRCNVSRAVMEGAARLLKEKLQELNLYGFHFEQAKMVGGPANSPVWPGIIEEITGIKLNVGDQSAGAKGAAMLAGIGVGIYQNEQDALKVWNSNHSPLEKGGRGD